MILRRCGVVILLSVFILGALGCGENGGGGNGGGSGGSAGVAGDKKLVDLTEAEEQQLCEALAAREASYRMSKEEDCEFQGYFSGVYMGQMGGMVGDEAVQDMCRESYDECMDEWEEDEPMFQCDGEDAGVGELDAPDRCTATVGQMEECFDAIFAWMPEMAKDAVACDEMTQALTMSDEAERLMESFEGLMGGEEGENAMLKLFPACEELNEACPELFE